MLKLLSNCLSLGVALSFSVIHHSAYGITDSQITPWVSSSHSGKIQKLTELIHTEKPTPIQNHATEKRFFGLSFSELDSIHLSCLTDIHRRYESSGARVSALDIGAGHGFMTWKLVVAGANVVAIEHQMPTALELRSNLLKSKEFLNHEAGETLKSVSRILVEDFLRLSPEVHRAQYDVIWSGMNLHFFSPLQLRTYLSRSFDYLKKDGKIYLATLAPPPIPLIFNQYQEQSQAGNPFPGFLSIHTLTAPSLVTISPMSGVKKRKGDGGTELELAHFFHLICTLCAYPVIKFYRNLPEWFTYFGNVILLSG